MKKSKKIYKIICIILLCIVFIFRSSNILNQSFWFDELEWTINFISLPNFFEMLMNLIKNIFNLPLYYILMFPFYRIVPYGELWLLLPNFIFVAIGIYMLKKIGSKVIDSDFGFICLCMAALSSYLISQGIMELRPYGLLFCLSSFVLYRYLCLHEIYNKKNIILYTISIILLVYTHWFGILITSFYFLFDLFLFIRNKDKKLSFIYPYIILLLVFLPYCILCFLFHYDNLTELYTWTQKPTLESIYNLVKTLVSCNNICIFLFIISLFYFIVYLIRKKKNNYRYLEICIGSIIYMILIVYVYSKYINPTTSLFVERYFIIVLPHIFILISIPLYKFINLDRLVYGKKIKLLIKITTLTIFTFIIILMGYKNYPNIKNNPYSNSYIYKDFAYFIADENLNKKAVILSKNSNAYLNYYFNKRGVKLPLNVINYFCENLYYIVKDGENKLNFADYEELLKYDKIYVFNITDEKIYNYITSNNYRVYKKDNSIYVYIRK